MLLAFLRKNCPICLKSLIEIHHDNPLQGPVEVGHDQDQGPGHEDLSLQVLWIGQNVK